MRFEYQPARAIQTPNDDDEATARARALAQQLSQPQPQLGRVQGPPQAHAMSGPPGSPVGPQRAPGVATLGQRPPMGLPRPAIQTQPAAQPTQPVMSSDAGVVVAPDAGVAIGGPSGTGQQDRAPIQPGPLDGSLDDQAARELAALQQQFANQTGQQLEAQRAAAGFAGMGLSGASQAAQGDIRNKSATDQALAQAGLLRGYRDEQRQQEQIDIAKEQAGHETKAFDIALVQLENELGTDLNGDGKIGTPHASSGETTASALTSDKQRTYNGDPASGNPTYHLEGIADGKFSDGDTYLVSDKQYDYYQGKDGSFYRVKQTSH